MGKYSFKRIVLLTSIILILLVVIIITRVASEQNGNRSNVESGKVVAYIMDSLINNNVPINKDDVFWRLTANVLVRKAAHFLEYLLIGICLATMLNVMTKKLWKSFPIATVVCFLLAYLDEYRQQFVEGREAAWTDVKIDTFGALAGIILVSISFALYNKFKQLNREIRELNDQLVKRLD